MEYIVRRVLRVSSQSAGTTATAGERGTWEVWESPLHRREQLSSSAEAVPMLLTDPATEPMLPEPELRRWPPKSPLSPQHCSVTNPGSSGTSSGSG